MNINLIKSCLRVTFFMALFFYSDGTFAMKRLAEDQGFSKRRRLDQPVAGVYTAEECGMRSLGYPISGDEVRGYPTAVSATCQPVCPVRLKLSQETTPVCWAAWNNDFATVERLLANLHMVDSHAETRDGNPLHFVMINSGEEVYKMLASCKLIRELLRCDWIDPNQFDRDGFTPLHNAMLAEKENSEAVRSLLMSPRLDINLCNAQGSSALHMAIERGFHEIAFWLISDPRINLSIPDAEGIFPLTKVVLSSNMLLVMMMLNGTKFSDDAMVQALSAARSREYFFITERLLSYFQNHGVHDTCPVGYQGHGVHQSVFTKHFNLARYGGDIFDYSF